MADNVETPNTEPAAAPAAGSESVSGASTETAGAPEAAVTGTPAADVVVERPADLPETFWDADAKAPKFGEIAARLARADELEAAETARKEGVPADAKDYALTPSGDPLVDATGKAIEIDPALPLAQAVTSVAHKHGLPQAVVSDFARAYIESAVADEKALKDALDAEVAKLGDKAQGRVDSVTAFIKQHCGENAEAAVASLGTAGAVQAWEAVMAKLAGASMTSIPNQDTKPKGVVETWFPSMKKTA